MTIAYDGEATAADAKRWGVKLLDQQSDRSPEAMGDSVFLRAEHVAAYTFGPPEARKTDPDHWLYAFYRYVSTDRTVWHIDAPAPWGGVPTAYVDAKYNVPLYDYFPPEEAVEWLRKHTTFQGFNKGKHTTRITLYDWERR